ncbi:hypothetical protein SEA_ANNADREAMY_210 [Streptomyces phage Annadreamy]|uniref:KH domain-containing protein n=3 Tax=Annadreamyvirus TaxID=2843347 RepID=A0A345GTM3_9CAUD|nr:hypothetical protein HWB75_gp068 [Streptomyces phage Annadreamy]YP_009839380.1 hypothetical protein HWB76_gp074 [Streptomyces phage Blueeyedbeauty]AXG66295.1 hypothetical protein SEA_ANNADREAMY_210 [Streptomyces phage Annadreamy]AXH49326.1 hypothetical protein SEA_BLUEEYEDBEAUTY_219 [Streptomyces phage Blueeyedbeauty]QGH79518.1 hypothetical protein SEA_LIMPID_217 [Streptomyces phage Limpid]
MIVRISTTQKRASLVDVQACLYGVESEILEAVDPADIKIELMGDPEKIAYVVGRTGSRIVSVLDKVKRTDTATV